MRGSKWGFIESVSLCQNRQCLASAEPGNKELADGDNIKCWENKKKVINKNFQTLAWEMLQLSYWTGSQHWHGGCDNLFSSYILGLSLTYS